MRSPLLVALMVFAFALALVSAELPCQPTIRQVKQTGWTDGLGVDNSVWDVYITAPADSALPSITLLSSVELDQLWEMDRVIQQMPIYWLPRWRRLNGGIPKGETHHFGYIIKSSQPTNFTISGISCLGPTPSPSPLPSRDPAVTPKPVNPTGAVCEGALVVDNYIVRNLGGYPTEGIRARYRSYFNDVIAFYKAYFGIEIRLTSIYVEATGSFSDSMDHNQLLTDFTNSVKAGRFGEPAPCFNHLITGRQPPGIGGLAYVNAACNFGTGFSVDGQASESPEAVIGRTIHELGHTFNGNHPDAYPVTLGYTCSINEDRSDYRILRRAEEPTYSYLNPLDFISDCATLAIKATIPTFSCMWSPETVDALATKLTLCSDESLSEGCETIPTPYENVRTCYNTASKAYDVSSFQVEGAAAAGIVGVQLFSQTECRGTPVEVRELSGALPSSIDNRLYSFRYLLQ